jgi:drug/metabolite transporter (DMT)-like permease
MTRAATRLALTAIGLWSFLALVGARLSHLPPFLVVAIVFGISGLAGLVRWRSWRVPPGTYLVGVAGLFGYHFFYFTAFRFAPAVELSLINYLWPLLIVVLSPLFLRRTRLRLHHVIGAVAGFGGAALIASGGRLHLDLEHLQGYLLMAAAALTWAVYSLLTKRLPPFPTSAVGGFCLTTSLLAFALCALEGQLPALATVTGRDAGFLVFGGLGPMGAAFYAWDAALKRGDPRVIGALAYLTPPASTLVLVLAGAGTLTWVSGVALVLIVAGAAIGSLDPGQNPRSS